MQSERTKQIWLVTTAWTIDCDPVSGVSKLIYITRSLTPAHFGTLRDPVHLYLLPLRAKNKKKTLFG